MSETAEKAADVSLVGTINQTMREGRVTQLAPNRLVTADFSHQTWVATPETGTPPEALLDSKYWAHYAVNPNTDLKPGDIVLVKPEDGTYFMELLVRSKYRGGVKVAALRCVKFDAAEESAEATAEYEVRHSGPKLKWRVVRIADKRELVSGLETRDAADQWLREHRKAFAA